MAVGQNHRIMPPDHRSAGRVDDPSRPEVAPEVAGLLGLLPGAPDSPRAVRALARLLTRVESGGPAAARIAAALLDRPRRARVIGLTGPPGVGKSTTVAALISRFRADGRTVAVLAVDPSSPLTGGALLGDRVRMAGAGGTDPGVFIRSMASRGSLGGLSAAAPGAVDLLDAVGFDVVLVETVGVGQNEVAILELADTVLLVLAPGLGDEVQAAKAGVLEIADVLAVNKADRPGAPTTVRELRTALGPAASGWRPPVFPMTAVDGTGVDDLVSHLADHAAWLRESGELTARRRRRARVTVRSLLEERVARAFRSPALRDAVERAADQVTRAGIDAHRAADQALEALVGQLHPGDP